MSEQGIKTTVRIGDMCFNINPSADEKGLIEFNVEEMDIDRNNEEYVCNSFYGTFSPDEIEYLANRMLDSVAYFKQTYDPNGFEMCESAKIAGALVHNRGDRKKTAEELKMSERTLYRKIKQYDLDTRFGL